MTVPVVFALPSNRICRGSLFLDCFWRFICCSTCPSRLLSCRVHLWLRNCLRLVVDLHEVRADEDVVSIVVHIVESLMIHPDVVQVDALIKLQSVQVLFICGWELIWFNKWFVFLVTCILCQVFLLLFEQQWHICVKVNVSTILARRGFLFIVLWHKWSACYGHNRFCKLLDFHLDDDLL